MSKKRAETLIERRRRAVQELISVGPILRASLIERYTQCGKGQCKCMRGEKHGPAYYLTVSYAGGRTRQVYVPKRIRTVVEQWVRNYHRAWAAIEEISQVNLELIRLGLPLTE